MKKSIISDLGNVVIFFDNHIFYRKIAEYSSLSSDEIYAKVVTHIGLSWDFDMGKVTPEEFYSGAITILKAEIDRDTFFSIYSDIFALNAPVLDIFKSLQTDYRLVLCSNTDVKRFEFIKNKFPEILIFDRYVVSYEVGVMKPHPRIYEVALEEAGTEAEDSVFIDDREENIKVAENLGIQAIFFGPETDLKSELQKRGVEV